MNFLIFYQSKILEKGAWPQTIPFENETLFTSKKVKKKADSLRLKWESILGYAHVKHQCGANSRNNGACDKTSTTKSDLGSDKVLLTVLYC